MATTTISDASNFSSNWKKLKESLPAKSVEEIKIDKRRRRKLEKKSKKEKALAKRISEEASETISKKDGNRDESDIDVAVEGTSDPLVNGVTLTKTLAMDCEFVGVGEDGVDSMLARISLVNAKGDCVYDKFVKPTEPVTDYRTEFSGIREADLVSAEEFSTVQQEVCNMIEGRKLVGHAIYNDFKVLHLSHPKKFIRDTSKYKPFRAVAHSKHPSLKKLCRLILGSRIQEGEHDSICDARSAMQLYQLRKREWETRLRNPRSSKKLSIEKQAVVGGESRIPTNARIARYRKIDAKRKEKKKTSGGESSSGQKNRTPKKDKRGPNDKYRGRKR